MRGKLLWFVYMRQEIKEASLFVSLLFFSPTQRAFDSLYECLPQHKYFIIPKQVIENAFQANKRTSANV